MRRYAKYLIASFVLLISVWLILLRAQYAGIAINHWTPTADMAFARAAACSALLPDGRVLVAGGNSSSGAVNTAELYGSNGTFALAAPMAQGRIGAACVTLRDGRVLVTGGSDGANALASAEIYDPAADTWTSAGTMAAARTGHTATLTPWGAVLIVGGESDGSVGSLVEMFLMNGDFRTVGNLSSPRKDYALAVLPGRKVLIAGGSDGNAALNTIDLFNADDNSISPAGTMLAARTNFAMATLLDGNVLITGGYGANGDVLASSEIYDPVKRATTDGPQLPVSRANHQAYTLPNNGRVILVGGSTDRSQSLTATDVFEPWTGQFARTASMNTARAGNASSLLKRGALIVAGGRNGSGYLTSSEVFGFATIETDQNDYPPGTPVVMTGSGWKPGEQVLVQVMAFPLDQHHVEFTGAAVADGTGKIKLTGFQVDKSHLGVNFLANATGSESRAQTLFSDADTTVVTGITVTPPSITSYPVNLHITGTVANQTSAGDVPYDLADAPPGANVLFYVDGSPIGGSGVGLDTFGNFDSGGSLSGAIGPGVHSITASWAYLSTAQCGTHTCNGSAYSFSYTVNPLSTIISNIGNTFPARNYGQTTDLSAEVDTNGPAGTYYPLGTLQFSDGAGTVLTCALPGAANPNNFCPVTTPTTLSPGIHTFTASYLGYLQEFSPTTGGTTTVTVSALATVTSLSTTPPSPASPQPYGTAVTFTATVTSTPGTPTGTVTFFSDGTQIGSAQTLVAGVAHLTTSTLAVGSHSITASYSPSPANFATSTSSAVGYQITGDATTTDINVAAGTTFGNFGVSTQFDVTVTNTGGSTSPTGSISLIDTTAPGTPVLGTHALTPTGGTTSTTSITVYLMCPGCALSGTFGHNIRAIYTPDSTNFNTSQTGIPGHLDWAYTSSPATFPPTPLIAISAPGTVVLGTSFTVNVNAASAELHGVMPTGQVLVYINGACGSCSPQTLVNGVANFTYSGADVSLGGLLSVGANSLSLSYYGDDNYSLYSYSTAAYTNNITATKAPTSAYTWTNPPSPIAYGNSASYNVTIQSPTNGAIGGTAAFFDNGFAIVACAGQPVSVGLAICPIALPTVGTHLITATWTGDPSYLAGGPTLPYTFVVDPEPTTTRVTPSVTTAPIGTTVTFTVNVNGSPVTPTGTAQVTNDTHAICVPITITLVNGTGSCTITYNGSDADHSAITHNIQAVYTPTPGPPVNFAASTSPVTTVTVTKNTPTLGPVSASGTPLTYGSPTTLSVTLSPVNPVPAYTVASLQFLDGGALVPGSVALFTATSTFSLTGVVLSAGSHNITAQYIADSNYNAAGPTAPLALTVSKATPVLSMAAPASPFTVTYGGHLTTGQISVPRVGSGVFPTGTVTLTAGPSLVQIGSVGTLDTAGHVTFTNAQLPATLLASAFAQSLVVTYSGDSNYDPAVLGGSPTITVDKAVPTGTVTTSGSSSAYNAPVTFTLTLGPPLTSPPSVGVPTGTVNFYSDGTLLNSTPATITGGVASYTTTALLPGAAHVITAVYSGDTNFTGPTTFTLAGGQTVTAAPTTTTLGSSAGSIALGNPVTYTATVSSPYSTPTGTVTFKDGATTLTCDGGVQVLSVAGVATCVINYDGSSAVRGAGNHNITAVYPGVAGTWLTSTSLAVTVSVSKVTPTMSGVTSSLGASPYTYGASTTIFSVTLTPASPAYATGTANVQFLDNGVVIATVAPSPGGLAATAAIVLTGGTHNITAQYLATGDPNYGPAGPTPILPIVVNKGTPGFTYSAGSYTGTYGGTLAGPTITVTGFGGAYAAPTGTFTLAAATSQIGGTFTASGAVTVAGTPLPTSLNVSSTPTPLLVSYSGDVNYLAPATPDGTKSITLSKATATYNLTAIPSTAGFNAPIAFTFTATSPTTGTPAGTVDFYDGVTKLNSTSIPTIGGQATFSYSSLTPGSHTIHAAFTDTDGNFNSSDPAGSTSVNVNAAATTTTLSVSSPTMNLGESVIFTVTVTGGPTAPQGTIAINDLTTGGLNLCTPFTLNVSGTQTCTLTYTGADASHGAGGHTYQAVYTPSSGTWATSTSASVSVTVSKVTPTLSGVTSSLGASPYTYGASTTTFSVTLTPASPAYATGTANVQFLDNGVVISTVAPTAGGVATSASILLTGGTHNITAQYLATGDPNYGPAGPTPILAITVNKAAPGFTYSAGSYTGTYGGTLAGPTITVTGAGGAYAAPTGTFTLTAATSQIGGTFTASGAVTVAGTPLPTSLNVSSTPTPLLVSYSGDVNYLAPATPDGTKTITLSRATATYSLLAIPSTSNYNGSIAFTFTATSPTTGTPVGTVDFYDGATLPANKLNTTSIPTIGGQAAFSYSSLTPGSHTIHAVFNDTDGNFNDSDPAGSTSVTVNAAATVTTLALSSPTVALNDSVTFTVTVTGGPTAPQGTIAINDLTTGGTNLCTPFTLNAGGTQTCTLTYNGSDASHSSGGHTYQAVYTPSSATWATSTSASQSDTVSKGTVTMSGLQSSATNGYTYGTLTNLSVDIAPPYPTPHYSPNIVQFLDGSTSLGYASVCINTTAPCTVQGRATLFGVLLGGGSHTITAVFLGDANWNTASDPITIVVAKADLSATTNFSQVGIFGLPGAPYGGQLPTSSATLTAVGSGLLPTGSVTITSGPTSSPVQIGGTFPLVVGASSVATTTGARLPATLNAGTWANSYVNYSGDANYNAVSFQGTITVTPVTPTATFSANPTSSNFNQSVTFTLTLSPPSGTIGTPTGTVDFKDGGVSMPGSPVPVNSAGTATFSYSGLAPGTHSITAIYSADVNFTVPTPTPTISAYVVGAAPTTTTVTPSTFSTTLNTSVTYTVTVNGGPANPVGTVTVNDNGNPLCSFTLTAGSGGTGSCAITYDGSANHGSGNHHVTASFAAATSGTPAPNTIWANSVSAPVDVQVNLANVTIGPVSSTAASPYAYGTTTILSATLGPINPAPAYTGQVQFVDNGSVVLATVSPVALTGTATTPAILLGAGLHSITAQYLGDTNYNASALSASLAITVNKVTPTVTVAGSPFTATFNGALSTGTINVTGPGGSAVSPTGTVTLSSGTAPVIPIPGTGTLSATLVPTQGTTSITTTLPINLPVGLTQNLTFTYNGDSNYNPATFSGSITVNPAPINVTVTVSNPSAGVPVYGQPVTFTATFAGIARVPASGSVDFVEGATTLCGGMPIVNNVATCTVPNATLTTPLSVAPHTVTVGTVTFNASDPHYTLTGGTITPVTFRVDKASTVTAVTSSLNPARPGESVTFTATVVVSTPGQATITGNTVTFSGVSGCTNLTPTTSVIATITTSGSVNTASCTTTFTAPGPVNISAQYNFDANTSSSTGTFVERVTAPQPTIGLSSIPGPTANYGQQVTFTASLTWPVTGATPPTGTIQFVDGSTNLGIPATLTSVGAPAGTVIATLSVPPGSAATPLLAGGLHQITALYSGDSNYSAVNSANQNPPVILSLTVNQATPVVTLAVTSSPSSPVYGQPVTLTATVVAPTGNTGVPTGTVTFYDAGNQVGQTTTLTLVSGVPTAAITVTSLGVGSHPNITAKYNGDANFVTVTSSAGSVTVGIASTTTTMTSPPTPATVPYGQNVTLSAQAVPVSPGAGRLAGTISFYDGSVDATHLLGTSGPVDTSGNGQIQVPAVAAAAGFQPLTGGSIVGAHHIVAVYNGGGSLDANFAASQSIAANNTLTINLAATTSSVVSSVTTSSVYGQPVTFTATVANPLSFGLLPTGTVTFIDGSTSTTLGTATLATSGGSSVATVTLPNAAGGLSLALGNHAISVTYGGDSNYATSSTPASSPLVQRVVKADTTSVLSTTCSTAPGCVVGQSVTLTASVTVNAPGVNAPIAGTTGTPTGTIQFYNGSTVLGNAPASLLVAGGSAASPTYTATLTTTLPQGQLQLTAKYSGDGNYNTSTSAIMTQGINTIAVTVVVNSNYSSVTYGTPLQFTATVTPVNTAPPPIPGTLPTPTGIVTFFDGGAMLCHDVQLSGGSAICNTSTTLSPGTHAISVQYTPTQDQTGSINFQPNNSAAVPVMVNKIPTSLNLTSSFTQGYAGQPITFTASVVANIASGVPYAGGQVQFFDGTFQSVSNMIGVANLASGVGVLQPTVNLAPGLHQIFAVYVGDEYYTGSTSAFAAITVNVAATTTQIFSSVNPSVVGQTVVFTITVGVNYPSTYGPNGQAQLYDNQLPIGNPVQANNGTFTITVPGLTPGTHNVYATFLANGSYGASTSPTVTQIVNKAPTATTLAALPVSSTSTQQVALTAVVNVPAPGSGTPTGTVQFVDTTFNKVLGSAPLTMIGGVYTASITTNQLVQSGAPQLLTATYSGDANFATSTSVPAGQSVFASQITVTNGASYYSSNFSPDSWATAWGSYLASTTLTASTTPLPTSLGGSTVQVTDAAGVQRLAPLLYVSPGQVNFMIPTNTAAGLATVTVTNGYGASASTIIIVSPTAPGLFSQDSSGSGLAAGQFIVVHADGSQTAPAQIAQYDPTTGQWVPAPIVATATDQVYLVLYGTGLRYKPSNASATATVNGRTAPVAYAGPQAQFVGEDQINLGPLTGLTGAGTVNVQVSVNGQPSNTVTVNFQ